MQVVWISLLVCSSILINLSVSIPTSTDHVETTLSAVVPLEFPKYNQNYTFVDNSSIRENLASHSENDTEVDDLLGNDVNEKSQTPSTIVVTNFEPDPSEQEEEIIFKEDTEWIEDGNDTEDTKFKIEIIEKVAVKQKGASLSHGHIAAILVGTFLLISIVVYVGLLSWRKLLELKYGSREMLVNEDDFIDPDDIKHFSI